MSGKGIVGVAVAILLAIVAFWVLKIIVKVALSLGLLVVVALAVGGAGYFLYRKFTNMLSSGKRLT